MTRINGKTGNSSTVFKDAIIGPEAPILVTGATGFIGTRVAQRLLEYGFNDVRCLVRAPRKATQLQELACVNGGTGKIQLIEGNLLSRADCTAAASGVAVVYHLAAGTGEKSFPDAFMNSVVTTKNLLDACVHHRVLKRFVSVSSFTVYSNRHKPRGRILDESAPVEERPELRGEAYCYAKWKQDQLVQEYGRTHGIPYVVIRPGVVYGPGKDAVTGRVGREMFGFFLHMGAGNRIPFTYVDNCAEAIVLSGLVRGVDGEVFNVVDDDVPSSRSFLRLYKREVRPLRCICVPRPLSFVLCYLWERYSTWSRGQLPPVFNRLAWHAYWKGNIPVNDKLKAGLGWRQRVPTGEGLQRYFAACREKEAVS